MLEINKIHCMDCIEGMKMLPDKSIDLTVTSPPYDNLRKYKGFEWDFEGVAKELFRITKDGGIVVWVVGDATIKGSETGTSFRQALYFKEIGFNLHDTMIYEKDSNPFPETNRYYPRFEYMFIFSKNRPKVVNLIKDIPNKRYGEKVASSTQREANGTTKKVSANKTNPNRIVAKWGVRGNIWKYSPGFNKSTQDKIAFKHPAIFPEQLANDHIISWSNEGDLVLDPFMGSGTTAKMALLNNRKFIGFEISEEYCKIAEKRISQIQPQQEGLLKTEYQQLQKQLDWLDELLEVET